MMRRSFKAHADGGNSSGRGILLWSIGGAVVFVVVVFVVLAQFSQPSNSAQPSWKNLVHTVVHPSQAFQVVKARIQHKPVPVAVAPTPAPTPTPAPAPTVAPATKTDAALADEAKRRAAAAAALRRAAAASHKAKTPASTIASSGTNVAASNISQPIGPIVPLTPAPRRVQPAAAAPPTSAPETLTDPSLIRQGAADYPTMARDQGVQGTTVVLVSVSPSGAVASASVAQSSGNRLLDDAALRAAYHSSFTPATKNGSPISSSARLVYTFSL